MLQYCFFFASNITLDTVYKLLGSFMTYPNQDNAIMELALSCSTCIDEILGRTFTYNSYTNGPTNELFMSDKLAVKVLTNI